MTSVLPENVDVAFEEQRFGHFRPRAKSRHKRSMDGDESGTKLAPVRVKGSQRPRSISMGARSDRTHELMYVPPFVQRAETGERVRLTSLWENCKAVVGFLRHFGCRSCWRDAAYLNSLKPTLDKHGVKLIAIAIGSPAQACAFKADTKFEGDLFVDNIPSTAPNADFPKFDPSTLPVAAEELKNTPGIQRSTEGYAGQEIMTKPTDASYAYASFRLKRGSKIVFRETIVDFVQPPDAGFVDRMNYGGTEARWPADFLQLGGLFVLGPGNHCDYAYRSYYVGDFPLDGEVLTAATGVKPEGQSFLFPSTQGWVDKLKLDTVVEPSTEPQAPATKPDVPAPPSPPTPPASPPAVVPQPVSPSPNLNSLFNAVPLPFHLSTLFSGLVLTLSVWATDHSVLRTAIAALSVLAIYLVVLLRSSSQSQSQSASSDVAQSESEDKPAEDEEPLTFFTPREIDEMVLAARASGKFEDCECNDVMGRIPMNLRLEPRPVPAINSAAEGEHGASSSDDSDLSDSSDDLSRRSSLSNLNKLVEQLQKSSSYEIRVYQTTLCYVREFLAKPHPLVGRPGPTCPFVPKSLRLNSINIRVIRTGANPSVDRMKKIALDCIPRFEALHPRTGRLSLYKAIILVFPDIPLEDAPRLIDGVQRSLKPSFVAKGMMVGEFHLKNNCPGLRNSKFFPLRTPYPSLAMRNMVPSDLVFLTMEQYEPQTRVSFLESYIRTLSAPKDADEDVGMADAAPSAIGASKELAIAREELEKVRQQLANGA